MSNLIASKLFINENWTVCQFSINHSGHIILHFNSIHEGKLKHIKSAKDFIKNSNLRNNGFPITDFVCIENSGKTLMFSSKCLNRVWGVLDIALRQGLSERRCFKVLVNKNINFKPIKYWKD